jgi:hypothetical protein
MLVLIRSQGVASFFLAAHHNFPVFEKWRHLFLINRFVMVSQGLFRASLNPFLGQRSQRLWGCFILHLTTRPKIQEAPIGRTTSRPGGLHVSANG